MLRADQYRANLSRAKFLRAVTMPALLLAGPMLAALPARAENYAFAAAPTQEVNRIYRVDRATGEVIACQFAVKDDAPIGLTLCHPAGEGAKAGEPGDYTLVASNHRIESGIFRVNRRNGAVNVCYVIEEREVVCAPPAR